ncbi:uncharacterized protein EV154DRAFT_510606 [Mucor mucedo]|uniref:uncharacterized protein n=1 Tax=Mucor mucedo TaxID=29922 RepID=UPI00221F1E49|nr:uncharacterized protein EV154DRAFT_510606 [Mucor mucedo]KAI7890674.1 hypothetical protein EV154DRAFT_510606 [Mucor mucedo]
MTFSLLLLYICVHGWYHSKRLPPLFFSLLRGKYPTLQVSLVYLITREDGGCGGGDGRGKPSFFIYLFCVYFNLSPL